MKPISYRMIVALLVAFAFPLVWASPGHGWKASVKVVNEAGEPLPEANVEVWYYVQPLPGKAEASEKVAGLTDNDGLFTASHGDTGSIDLRFRAAKSGYYKTSIGHEFARFKEEDSAKWNPTITLVLKKVGTPIPMYAKRILQGPPATNKAVGYDLMTGHWVAPHGKGISTDIIFTRHLERKAKHDYDDLLEVAFPNAGDGIQSFTVPDDQTYSGLRSPHEAPAEGYQTRLVRETSEHPGQGLKFDYDATRNYFFRVRTVLDERGKVKSALYGKIYGDFMQFSSQPSHGFGKKSVGLTV